MWAYFAYSVRCRALVLCEELASSAVLFVLAFVGVGSRLELVVVARIAARVVFVCNEIVSSVKFKPWTALRELW